MFCTNCGNSIADEKFCTECGFSTDSKRNNTPVYTYVPQKTVWQRFFRFVYPKVKQDKAWHRLVFIFGWLISVASLTFFPVTFIIYFGIIQRGIFFVVYGEDKSKWLVKD